MIKISEACDIMRLVANEAGKSRAREVLNYFEVKTSEEPVQAGKFGKPSKLYDKSQVEQIAELKGRL